MLFSEFMEPRQLYSKKSNDRKDLIQSQQIAFVQGKYMCNVHFQVCSSMVRSGYLPKQVYDEDPYNLYLKETTGITAIFS